MKFPQTKLLISVLVLSVYISIGVFGLWQFSHVNEAPMPNCPYAENGFSICDNGISHINNWRQFTNTTMPSLFVLMLLIFGIILYFFNQWNFSKQKLYFYKWKYNLYNNKLYISPNRIIKWLALLENSPSFNVV